jgi:ABC-type branched-subunit amino acid transport system substrate-binding protein
MRRWLVVLTVFSLLLLVAQTGCSGCKGERTSTILPIPTITVTPTPTVYSTATVTTALSDPVKIGAIGPWSGPMGMSGVLADQAIALVEWQVKNMGGILGGREIKFVRGDDRGMVARGSRLMITMHS